MTRDMREKAQGHNMLCIIICGPSGDANECTAVELTKLRLIIPPTCARGKGGGSLTRLRLVHE